MDPASTLIGPDARQLTGRGSPQRGAQLFRGSHNPLAQGSSGVAMLRSRRIYSRRTPRSPLRHHRQSVETEGRWVNFRRLAMPPRVAHWTLTTLREKLIKAGAKVARHARICHLPDGRGRSATHLYREILRRIARLRELAIPPLA